MRNGEPFAFGGVWEQGTICRDRVPKCTPSIPGRIRCMGGLSIKLDLGTALPLLEEKAKRLFGKDFASQEAASWIAGLQNTALTQSSSVQCVGMHKPVPFDDIYQPTTLVIKGTAQPQQETYAYQDHVARSIVASHALSSRRVNIERFLASPDDAIVFAGPGWGKTTFLRYLYRRHVGLSNVFPVLVSLRRPTAVDDLTRFVETVDKIAKKHNQQSLLLLVDGYDEIGLAQQRLVSEALLRFQGFKLGKFYLSCREYYDVMNLSVPEVRISGFTLDEKYKFVAAFLKAFESKLDAKQVVDELEERRFGDFLAHPLLLALACIVRTSPSSVQPRSALRLLERAIEVLSERWDAGKGLIRETVTPLDGRDRIQLLKRLAYTASSGSLTKSRAETTAQAQIDLMDVGKVDARKALLETARFYGIFVPTDDGWEFVHRTVHDYLAASYWVETGGFATAKRHDWNARTAYAACLTQDATAVFIAALRAPDGLPAAAEMLNNGAPLSPKEVAPALRLYFSQPGRMTVHSDPGSTIFTVSLSSDFICGAGTRVLDRLVDECAKNRTTVGDALVAYCLLELKDRGLKLEYMTYEALRTGYRRDDFVFQVPGAGNVSIAEMNPATVLPRLLASVAKRSTTEKK
jgi:hypothetical protein